MRTAVRGASPSPPTTFSTTPITRAAISVPFDTKTGKFVEEWPSPGGPKSQPYGITTVNGIIWYSESAVKPNTLVRFDPKTEKFQTWAIPAGGGVVRNMMHTTDGKLVLTESGVNMVALVTVKTNGKVAMDAK